MLSLPTIVEHILHPLALFLTGTIPVSVNQAAFSPLTCPPVPCPPPRPLQIPAHDSGAGAAGGESGLTRKESMVIHNEASVYDLPPDMGAMDFSGYDSE